MAPESVNNEAAFKNNPEIEDQIWYLTRRGIPLPSQNKIGP
jgi:hypothetical protein